MPDRKHRQRKRQASSSSSSGISSLEMPFQDMGVSTKLKRRRISRVTIESSDEEDDVQIISTRKASSKKSSSRKTSSRSAPTSDSLEDELLQQAIRDSIQSETKTIKAEQDREYAESLKQDRLKDIEERKKRREKSEEEELKQALEASRVSLQQQSLEELKQEPDKDDPNAVTFAFRLPAGLGKNRLTRRFFKSDTMSTLSLFIQSDEDLCKIHWLLVEPHPRTILEASPHSSAQGHPDWTVERVCHGSKRVALIIENEDA